MTDLYLIAHKVRGEPAFDIAERQRCPKCNGTGNNDCAECDEFGFWWIVSTSGHRAYPYRTWNMEDLYDGSDMDMPKPCHVLDRVDPPADWPDHYPTRSSPKSNPSSGKSLLAQLGLIPKVVRRL